MRTRIALLFAAGLALFCALSSGNGRERTQAIKLNQKAVEFAQELIKEGHAVADKRTAWRDHQPSAEKENEFIRQHGFAEYAKWHLGIDETHPENTKARYRFPYGDFEDLHRCALLAVKSRAAQYGHEEIANAAAQLERLIEASSNGQR
jgi:hypothetical protein